MVASFSSGFLDGEAKQLTLQFFGQNAVVQIAGGLSCEFWWDTIGTGRRRLEFRILVGYYWYESRETRVANFGGILRVRVEGDSNSVIPKTEPWAIFPSNSQDEMLNNFSQ